MSIRVLVVDDHESVRKGVCAILSSRKDVEICGEASNGKDAVSKADSLKPQIIIMDISMPIMDGISATREILNSSPDTAIVMLSMHNSKEMVENAKRIGARAFVTKAQAGAALLQALDSALRGEPFFPTPSPA
ncbi:MAG TPA: response regulator transcription factor [Candidatus Limnocylindrales bacterium]|nr:response regulator transcription factor [Candidatus Limnocylindrales bacterium]